MKLWILVAIDIPGHQDTERHEDRRHQHQRQTDSVETQAIVNGRGRDPATCFGELHLIGRWIEEPPERQEGTKSARVTAKRNPDARCPSRHRPPWLPQEEDEQGVSQGKERVIGQ